MSTSNQVFHGEPYPGYWKTYEQMMAEKHFNSVPNLDFDPKDFATLSKVYDGKLTGDLINPSNMVTDGTQYAFGPSSKSLDSKIIIKNHEKDVVTINLKDGTVKFGPSYTFDEASKVWWESLAGDSPRHLREMISKLEDENDELSDENDDLLEKNERLNKYVDHLERQVLEMGGLIEPPHEDECDMNKHGPSDNMILDDINEEVINNIAHQMMIDIDEKILSDIVGMARMDLNWEQDLKFFQDKLAESLILPSKYMTDKTFAGIQPMVGQIFTLKPDFYTSPEVSEPVAKFLPEEETQDKATMAYDRAKKRVERM